MGDVMDRTIILMYLSLAMGTMAFFIFQYFGVILVALWIIVFLFFIKKLDEGKLSMLLLGFFLLGILDCHLYFQWNTPGETLQTRILEERNGYYTGDWRIGKIRVISNEKLDTGEVYILNGKFNVMPDYPYGVIGDFKSENIVSSSKDIISENYSRKKRFFKALTEDGIDSREAAEILALSMGDSSYMEYEGKEELSTLGISHVISVSGLHLTLVYAIAAKLLGSTGGIITAFLYVILTGGKASTIRAFIMAFLMAVGVKVRQRYDGISALAGAAFILLVIRPYSLLEPGYMLSFLAVLGMQLLNKKIDRALYKLPDSLRKSLAITLSAMIFTVPYLIFIFNEVSIGGLISNLVLVPFYSILVIAGIIGYVTLDIPWIFHADIKFMAVIFKIIGGFKEVLIYKLPKPIPFTYLQGMIILTLYLTYCLYRKGHKYVVFYPLIALILVLKEPYVIFPEINYISGKKSDIIEVDYKGDNFLISGEKVKLRYVYEDMSSINRIYDEFEDEIEIKLDKNYDIIVKKNGRSLCGFIKYKDKKIMLPEHDDNDSGSKGHYYEKLKCFGDTIIEKYIDCH